MEYGLHRWVRIGLRGKVFFAGSVSERLAVGCPVLAAMPDGALQKRSRIVRVYDYLQSNEDGRPVLPTCGNT